MSEKPKGWFVVKGRDGDRTAAEQLTGLEPVLARCAEAATVLDLGCAEGMIAHACHKAGAAWALGLEARRDAVAWANRHLAVAGRLGFVQADLNNPAEWGHSRITSPLGASGGRPGEPGLGGGGYDIVLALSIAHKLDDPAAFLRRAADVARDWLVIRLPSPRIETVGAGRAHKRPLDAPVDVPLAMRDLGFRPLREVEHPRLEWGFIYQRAKGA